MSTVNNIGDEGAKALSQCLTHLPQLVKLDLRGLCAQIDLLLDVICDVMSTDNDIGDEGANALICYLMCDVTLMCVMCVNTGNKIEVEGSKALSQCLTNLTQLVHFNLSGECVHIDVLLDV